MTAKSGSTSFGSSRMNFRVRKTVAPCLALLLSVTAPSVFAQSAETDKAKLSASERAQRDADKVFHWIKLNSSAPRQAAAPAPAPTAAPAPARKVAQQEAPAVAPAPSAIRETVTPVTAKAAAPAAAPVTAPAVAAAPVPAAASEALPERTQIALAPPTATRSIATPPPAPAPAKVAEPEPDLPLELISRVEPDIPRQLLASLRNGSVHVRFDVQPDGSVRNAEAIKSNHKRLAQAAVAAVTQWRFKPVPRAREATVELGFQLE